MQQSAKQSFTKNFIAAGALGAGVKTITFPVEQIKLVLQVQDLHPHSSKNDFRGIFDAVKRISKKKGVIGLWRGNFDNVVRYYPTQAINFACKHAYKKRLIKGVHRHDQFWTYFFLNLVAGGLAGATSLCFVYPLDYSRTRLAADFGKTENQRQFRDLPDCLKKTFNSDGIKGIYRGFFVSIQGIILYRACYHGIFDNAKEMAPNLMSTSFLISYPIALAITSFAGIITYPFDTVRRRMMMQSGRKNNDIVYKSVWDCWIKMATKEGLPSFFKGGWSNVILGTGAALQLVWFENIKSRMYVL